MLNVVVGVLGAVRSTLKFVPFEATDGNFYLRVEGYECWANNETLSPQYNLGSVLIPGTSPLAYQPQTSRRYDYNHPEFSDNLPEWWLAETKSKYRIRQPGESIIRTGLFIPELEPDGQLFSSTKVDESESTVGRGSAPSEGSLKDRSKYMPKFKYCRVGNRSSSSLADLELVAQSYVYEDANQPEENDFNFQFFDQDTNDGLCGGGPVVVGNITGYKYAPTGVLNFRLHADVNEQVAEQLSRIPLGMRARDKSVTPDISAQHSTFYTRAIKNMQRYPGMVPITAPYGRAGPPHESPGRPFFTYSLKQCPGHPEWCCLAIDGDGEMAGASAQADAAAAVTRELPSKLFKSNDTKEGYLQWNALATHTSFSRVVPDIASLNLAAPFRNTHRNEFKGNLPEDPITIFGHENNPPSLLPIPEKAVSASNKLSGFKNQPSSKMRLSVWGKANPDSPKCDFQRYSGAREREAAMFLEHYAVAYTGETEVHQLNKKKKARASRFRQDNPQDGDPNFRPPNVDYTQSTEDVDDGDLVYKRSRPFAIEMTFNPGEGNIEKHVEYPMSRLPLWLNGGTKWNRPWYCDRTCSTADFNTDDDVFKDVSGYYGNIPCALCRLNAVHQYENLVAAMLKRYGKSDNSANANGPNLGCANSFKAQNNKYFPNAFQNPSRFRYDNAWHYTNVCAAEEFRVFFWDIDQTFKSRGTRSKGGYRVDRSSDSMVHLLRLHTGAAPVARADTQMGFTNYRPVRSLDSNSKWSSETMCFLDTSCPTAECVGANLSACPAGCPGSEECASTACGSGHQWCNNETSGTGNDFDAPWGRLAATGTSDGTFRNNFWQSVCWVDPFFESPFKRGATPSGGLNNEWNARTFTGGSLFPGDSMVRTTSSYNADINRGGTSNRNGQGISFMGHRWGAATPHMVPFGGPLSNWNYNSAFQSTSLNYRGYVHTAECGVEDFKLDPLCNGHGWRQQAGIGMHTCADTNNRTFYSSNSFGRRGIMEDPTNTLNLWPAQGEAWDMRWSFAKSSLSYSHFFGSRGYQGAQFSEDRNSHSTNVDMSAKYFGPVGTNDSDILPRGGGDTITGFKTSKFPWECSGDGCFSVGAASEKQTFSYGNIHATPTIFYGSRAYDDAESNRNKAKYFTSDDFDIPDQTVTSNFGNPYWMTPPVARGCSTPANSPWAFPGLVMNDGEGCAEIYTAAMDDECKYAAWAPPNFNWNPVDDSNNRFIPQPIFNPNDNTRGPRWPSTSFETIYGWTNLPHVGRIDWDAHTLAWEGNKQPLDGTVADIRKKHKYEGYSTIAGEGGTFSGGHTLGPYPMRGKNDGILECPSNLLDRDFLMHQHIYLYSTLKSADICDPSNGVDESGINDNGVAQYRDEYSWCVNPENVAQDVCRSIVTSDASRDSVSQGTEQQKELYQACFGAFSDSRTLVDDEAEAHSVGEFAAENTRRLCRCDGKPYEEGLDLSDFGTKLYDRSLVPGFCICRSLARTTRVVVGPDALYQEPEKNIESPAFLNVDSNYNFPLCTCGAASPCLIRRTCARGQLGNAAHPVGNLDMPIDAATLSAVPEFKYTPTAVNLVGRSSTYAYWELQRLSECTAAQRTADCTDVTVFPIAAASGTRPSQGFEALGVRNQIFILDSAKCSGTLDPSDPLYEPIWGTCAVSLKIPKSGKDDAFVCEFVVENCDSVPGLLRSLGARVSNNMLAIETFAYQEQFSRTVMGRMAYCLQYTFDVINNIESQFGRLCIDDGTPFSVQVRLPPSLKATKKMVANGRCRSPGKSEPQTFTSETKASDTTFVFDTLCAGFVGVFGYQESTDAITYEAKEKKGLWSGTLGTSQANQGVCTAGRVAIKLNANTVPGKPTPTEFSNEIDACATGSQAAVEFVVVTAASPPAGYAANTVYTFGKLTLDETIARSTDVSGVGEVYVCLPNSRNLGGLVASSQLIFGECKQVFVAVSGWVSTESEVDVEFRMLGSDPKTIPANTPVEGSIDNVESYAVSSTLTQEIVPFSCRSKDSVFSRVQPRFKQGVLAVEVGQCPLQLDRPCMAPGEEAVILRGYDAVEFEYDAVSTTSSVEQCRTQCIAASGGKPCAALHWTSDQHCRYSISAQPKMVSSTGANEVLELCGMFAQAEPPPSPTCPEDKVPSLVEGRVFCVPALCPTGYHSSVDFVQTQLHPECGAGTEIAITRDGSMTDIQTNNQSVGDSALVGENGIVIVEYAIPTAPEAGFSRPILGELQFDLPYLFRSRPWCNCIESNGSVSCAAGTPYILNATDSDVGEVNITVLIYDPNPIPVYSGVYQDRITVQVGNYDFSANATVAEIYIDACGNCSDSMVVYVVESDIGNSTECYTPAASVTLTPNDVLNVTATWCMPPDPSQHLCQAHTECSESEFESRAPSAAFDRQCTTKTRCNYDNEYESTVATATSDRRCSARVPCNYDTTFVQDSGAVDRPATCAPRTPCNDENTYVSDVPAVADLVCQQISECSNVSFELQPPTLAADRACKLVRDKCAQVAEYESRMPTGSTDRECVPTSACVGAQLETVAPGETSDRECGSIPESPEDAEDVLPEWAAWSLAAGGAVATLARWVV